MESIFYYTRRFPCELDFFAWGVLFAGLFVFLSHKREHRSLSFFGYAGLLCFVGVILLDAYDFTHDPDSYRRTLSSTELFHFLPAASTFLILFFIFNPDCVGTRLLAHPWLKFVGIVSYEWFLIHLPFVTLFRYAVGNANGSVFLYLVATVLPLALTLALSAFIYRFFSLPILNKIRGDKRFRAKQPAAA